MVASTLFALNATSQRQRQRQATQSDVKQRMVVAVALVLLEMASQTFPDSVPIAAERSRIALEMGHLEVAVDSAERVFRGRPGDLDAAIRYIRLLTWTDHMRRIPVTEEDSEYDSNGEQYTASEESFIIQVYSACHAKLLDVIDCDNAGQSVLGFLKMMLSHRAWVHKAVGRHSGFWTRE